MSILRQLIEKLLFGMADDRAEEIVKAIKARNSVLLDELFENMTSSERANVLASSLFQAFR